MKIKIEAEILAKTQNKNKRFPFEQWTEKFFSDIMANPNLSPNYKKRLSYYKKHIQDFFSLHVEYVDEIDVYLIDEYINHRLRYVSAKTVNDELFIIKRLIRKAMDYEIIPESRLPEKIQNCHLRKYEPKVFDYNELIALLNHMENNANPVHFLRVKFLAFSGCRIGELGLIRTGDVRYHEKYIAIVDREGEHTKTRMSRKIPLWKPLIEVIEALPEARKQFPKFGWRKGYLFPKPSEPSHRWLRHAFYKAQKELGIEPIRRIHDLRHTFSTLLVEKGLPSLAVQSLLGHTNMRMTQKYTHVNTVKLTDTLESLFI